MSHPPKSKPAKNNRPLDDSNQPRISKGIYAMGYSFKDGVIYGLVTFVTAIAILALGRRGEVLENGELTGGNFVARIARKLEGGHGKVKDGIAKGIEEIVVFFGRILGQGQAWRDTGRSAAEFATRPTTTVAAGVAAAIVGHFVQIPAAFRGKWKAEEIARHYDDVGHKKAALEKANNKLSYENKILAEDNARLNEALGKIQRPDPLANKENGQSCGA